MNDASATNDSFEDPLEDYSPKTYSDPLEEALAENTVASIQQQPLATIQADQSVAAAIGQLASQHVACLIVEEDNQLVGVFTDRDVLDKVALESNLERPVRDVMTQNPVYVYETDPAAAALCVMAVSGYRHVPVLDAAERVVGIISPQRVTKFLLQRFEE